MSALGADFHSSQMSQFLREQRWKGSYDEQNYQMYFTDIHFKRESSWKIVLKQSFIELTFWMERVYKVWSAAHFADYLYPRI